MLPWPCWPRGPAYTGGFEVKDYFQELLQHPEFVEGRYWRREQTVAGEYIVREGMPGTDVYLILAGRVRVLGEVILQGAGRIRPGIFELAAGEVFGELALFDNGARSASVVAVTDCELAVLDGPALMAFLDAHPQEGYCIMKALVSTLVGRLRGTNRKLLSLLAWGVKARGIDEYL